MFALLLCALHTPSNVLLIIVIARLPGIYGNVNRPCPRATPSDSVGLLP